MKLATTIYPALQISLEGIQLRVWNWPQPQGFDPYTRALIFPLPPQGLEVEVADNFEMDAAQTLHTISAELRNSFMLQVAQMDALRNSLLKLSAPEVVDAPRARPDDIPF